MLKRATNFTLTVFLNSNAIILFLYMTDVFLELFSFCSENKKSMIYVIRH